MDSEIPRMTTLPDGPWTVATGENDGQPLFVRINTGAAAVARQSDLAHRIGVAVPLRAPDASGLPAPAESAILTELEDALEAVLDVGQNTILVLVLTTGGVREFVLYTVAPHATEAAIAQLQSQFAAYELQFYVQLDAEWDGYTSFAEAL